MSIIFGTHWNPVWLRYQFLTVFLYSPVHPAPSGPVAAVKSQQHPYGESRQSGRACAEAFISA